MNSGHIETDSVLEIGPYSTGDTSDSMPCRAAQNPPAQVRSASTAPSPEDRIST